MDWKPMSNAPFDCELEWLSSTVTVLMRLFFLAADF
jgi:hypothetical protein